LLFHSGNAMLSPTSRTAKIVSVFATRPQAAGEHGPHNQMRRLPQIRRDVRRSLYQARGSVHRAQKKTPITMLSDITTGDNPSVTSFVGASAAPSHAAGGETT